MMLRIQRGENPLGIASLEFADSASVAVRPKETMYRVHKSVAPDAVLDITLGKPVIPLLLKNPRFLPKASRWTSPQRLG